MPGAVEVYNQDGFVQLQTPGTRDVIVLEEKSGAAASPAGMSGGIAHFGFRLIDPADIDAAGRARSRVRRRHDLEPGGIRAG